MSLEAHNAKFERRLTRLEGDFLRYAGSQMSHYERWYRLEGLLSQAWQSWGEFCRSVVVESCLGTVALGGRAILRANPGWTTEQRVCYEAHCAIWNNTPKPGKIISRRKEHTWGDVGKLVVVVGKLQPANSVQLLGGFGSGLAGPNHLQTVRNAAAHINPDNAAEVRRLKAYYFGPSLRHPTDLATWSNITSRTPAFVAWLLDMRAMAAVTIQ